MHKILYLILAVVFIICASLKLIPEGGNNAPPCDSLKVTFSVPSEVCEGYCATVTALASGGMPPYSYLWSDGQTGNPITICSPYTSVYTVVVYDAAGCSKTEPVTIIVRPFPVIMVSQPTQICIGACTQLTAIGGIIYSWTPPTGLSCTNCPNPIACPFTTTSYTVTGTDYYGCSNTAITTVLVNQNPLITPCYSETKICLGKCTKLCASGGLTYSWSPTGTDPNNVCPTVTTTYSVTGTDQNGCVGVGKARIVVDPNCHPADLGPYPD